MARQERNILERPAPNLSLQAVASDQVLAVVRVSVNVP
jgi:hypothetical protein